MIDLKQILSQKWQNKTLALFYLLRAPNLIREKKTYLRHWMVEFIYHVESRSSPKKKDDISDRLLPIQHPDLLHLCKDKDKEGRDSITKEYTLQEFDEFFTTFYYRPLEWPYRIVIVEDVHLIGEALVNKLLKSLEEGMPQTSIFFLHWTDSKLLPTLSGRAIHLKIPAFAANRPSPVTFFSTKDLVPWFSQHILPLEKKIESRSILPSTEDIQSEEILCHWPSTLREIFLDYLQSGRRSLEILEKIKNNKEIQLDLLSLILEWERQHNSSFSHKKKFLEEIQWFMEAQIYYNAPGERWASLLHTLRAL